MSHISSALMEIGHSLRRKFGTALVAMADARAAFERFDAGVPDEERERWLLTERDAMDRWKVDVTAMDIYEIQMDRGE